MFCQVLINYTCPISRANRKLSQVSEEHSFLMLRYKSAKKGSGVYIEKIFRKQKERWDLNQKQTWNIQRSGVDINGVIKQGGQYIFTFNPWDICVVLESWQLLLYRQAPVSMDPVSTNSFMCRSRGPSPEAHSITLVFVYWYWTFWCLLPKAGEILPKLRSHVQGIKLHTRGCQIER